MALPNCSSQLLIRAAAWLRSQLAVSPASFSTVTPAPVRVCTAYSVRSMAS